MSRFITRCVLFALLALQTGLVSAQNNSSDGEEFTDYASIPIEDLMNLELEVTSVSRRAQPVSKSAAAVYVLTQEDLRRSGVTTMMEALRMVPGLSVARINSNTWAISSRGFNQDFSDKVLVLMDGRTLFTPLFNGTFWDVQDYPLEDIDRIEVIRGPGTTLWGPHAVNGVINIITKSSHDTIGGLVVVGAGNVENGFGHFRQGGSIGENASYRVYGRYFDRGDSERVLGASSNDDWDQARFGFRTDWVLEEGDTLTVQGDTYRGDTRNVFDLASATAPPVTQTVSDADVQGGNLLSRWNRTLDEDSDISVQIYYDNTYRDIRSLGTERRDTWDLDFQHQLVLGSGNRLVWGLGYRLSNSDLNPRGNLAFNPTERHDQLFSGFVQDELQITDRFSAVLGTKLEHNDYTQFEVQPTLRALWRRTDTETWWAGVSRAVNTPSQGTSDSTLTTAVIPGGGFNTLVNINGNNSLESEKVLAYELGYRSLVVEDFSLDISLFYNVYDDLRSIEPGTPFPSGADFIAPLLIQNKLSGDSYGAEVASQWDISRDWSLHGSYSLMELDLKPDSGSLDTTSEASGEGSSPEQQAHLRSYYDVSEEFQFNIGLFWVDSLFGGSVESYFRSDLSVEWSPNKNTTLRLAALGLFHGEEAEFGSGQFQSGTELEESIYAQLTYRY